MKLSSFIFILILSVATSAQSWQKHDVGTNASFRGLSVVSDNVVWASGTKGTVVKTIDGGKTWQNFSVPDGAKLDFRDIEAFDDKTAYILSIGNGTASRIYKTSDGGKTWQQQFKNADPNAFFDAIACWNAKQCIAMSDPVDGKYLLITTTDGETWQPIKSDKLPAAETGEAAFAASGTCLIAQGDSTAYLVTGGSNARVFRSYDKGVSWAAAATPMVKGNEGSGIFSIAMRDGKRGIIVGGNYAKPGDAASTAAFTHDGGRTWKRVNGLGGYRSGVAFLDNKTIIAVGTSGSEISTDRGETWKSIGKEDLNVVTAKGKTAWAAGPNGMLAKLLF